MSKGKKISLIILSIVGFIFIFYTVFGFFGVPYILKKVLPSSLKKDGIELKIEDAKFNPFSYNLNIKNISIKTFDNLFSADNIYIKMEFSRLFTKTILIKKIKLQKPNINIVKDNKGVFNFDAFSSNNEESSSGSLFFNFILKHLEIVNGKFAYTDNSAKKPFNISLDDIDYTISDINIKDESIGHHTLVSSSSLAKHIAIDSGVKIKPLTFHGNIKIDELDLKAAATSLLETMPVNLQSGKLDTKINFNIVFSRDDMYFLMDDSNLELKDVSILDANDSLLLKKFSIPSINLASRIKPYDISGEGNFESLNIKDLNYTKIGHIDTLDLTQNDVNISIKDEDFALDINSSDLLAKNVKFDNKALLTQTEEMNASRFSLSMENKEKNLFLDTKLGDFSISQTDFLMGDMNASLSDGKLKETGFKLKGKDMFISTENLLTKNALFKNKLLWVGSSDINASKFHLKLNNENNILIDSNLSKFIVGLTKFYMHDMAANINNGSLSNTNFKLNGDDIFVSTDNLHMIDPSFKNKMFKTKGKDLNATKYTLLMQNDKNFKIDTNLSNFILQNADFAIHNMKATLNNGKLNNTAITMNGGNITVKNGILDTIGLAFFVNNQKFLTNSSSNLKDFAYYLKNKKSSINGVNYKLKETNAFDKDGSKIASFNSLNLKGLGFDISDLNLNIKKVDLDALNLKTDIDQNGKVSLVENIPIKTESKSSSIKSKTTYSSPKSKEFTYDIKEINVNNSKADINVKMNSAGLKHSFDGININLKNINSKYDNPLDVSLNANSKNITLKSFGKVGINPFKMDLNTTFSHHDLACYMPFVKDFTDMRLQSGKLDFSGIIGYDKTPSVKGNAELSDISILDKEDISIFAIKSLGIQNIEYENNGLVLDNISLKKPYLNVYIDKEKNVNLSKVVKKTKDNTEEEKQIQQLNKPQPQKDDNSSDTNIVINKIALEDGVLDFSDYSIFTPFITKVSNIQSKISSIRKDKISRIDMEGTIGKSGYSAINIHTKPFEPKEYTKVNMTFKDINLPDITPYSKQFAGYELDGGKLNLTLIYDINNATMVSQNIINLDSLKLGKRVKSEESVDMPLRLAAAILKDSQNQINLSIPIKGDLSNPNFDYSGVVLKALSQLFTDILTSPFKIIVSTLGIKNDPRLDSIDFRPGDDRLIVSEKAKIPTLAQIMSQKEDFIITITPAYNKELDNSELQKNKFDDEISYYMIKEDMSYQNAFNKLKTKFFGNKKFESQEEATKALISKYEIKSSYFDDLALSRAKNIKDELIATGVPENKIEILKTDTSGEIKQKSYIMIKMGIKKK